MSSLPYVFALELFFLKLKAKPVLRDITLLAATTSARYSAYTSSAKIDQVGIDIRAYETIKSTTISLFAFSWVSISGSYLCTDGPCKKLGIYFVFDIHLEMNSS